MHRRTAPAPGDDNDGDARPRTSREAKLDHERADALLERELALLEQRLDRGLDRRLAAGRVAARAGDQFEQAGRDATVAIATLGSNDLSLVSFDAGKTLLRCPHH